MTTPETRPETTAMSEENSVQGSAVITHEIGLHARPSVKLTKLAKSFESQIHLRGESVGEGGASWVDATSFTSTDLAAGHVRFVHDGSVTAPDFKLATACALSFVGELALSRSTAHSRSSFGTFVLSGLSRIVTARLT